MMTPHAANFDHTVADLATDAERLLIARYGTCAAPRRGYGYHNRDHGADVATAAGRLARILHDAGRVSWETMRLAPYAGWSHDAKQGRGHEQRSAVHAERAMRMRGMDDRHVAIVRTMIAATEVTGVDGYRLVQAADPSDPRQALLADADLSSLGGLGGVYRALLLDLEQQHLAGNTVPDRGTTIRFLAFQVGLFREHRYLLAATSRLYPHQQANAELIGQLRDLYTADRISRADMFDRAKRHTLILAG